MTVHAILKMGDPRLLAVARPVERFGTPALHELVADMFETMRSVEGAGSPRRRSASICSS
jgi:peptide deformylase